MIGYISTKLLLIGIIKNYNRGSFILAVISFAPPSINIVALGLPIRMEEVLRALGEDREAWKQTPRQTADLLEQAHGSIEGARRPPQVGNHLLVRRKERLRRPDANPI